MAKKGTRRTRRSPEEIIADLQAEIARVKARAAQKEIKQSPAHKAALNVVRGLAKAADTAREENAMALAHALADAREALAKYFDEQGVELPKARRPRGRRAKV